jgi:ABC-type phosphate transport system auxiliary subunit
MAYDLIEKLRAAIVARSNPLTSLTQLERSILTLSSLPLARYAAMTQTTGIVSGAANAMQYDIAQLVALDAVSNLVRINGQILDKALASNSKLDNVLQERAEKIRDRLKDIREEINRYTMMTYALRGKPFEKMEELAKIERSMYSSLNANLAASARFAKRN